MLISEKYALIISKHRKIGTFHIFAENLCEFQKHRKIGLFQNYRKQPKNVQKHREIGTF